MLSVETRPQCRTPENKAFYEFMLEVPLEPLLKGIATDAQTSYLEQLTMDSERANPEVELVSRGEETLTSRAAARRVGCCRLPRSLARISCEL